MTRDYAIRRAAECLAAARMEPRRSAAKRAMGRYLGFAMGHRLTAAEQMDAAAQGRIMALSKVPKALPFSWGSRWIWTDPDLRTEFYLNGGLDSACNLVTGRDALLTAKSEQGRVLAEAPLINLAALVYDEQCWVMSHPAEDRDETDEHTMLSHELRVLVGLCAIRLADAWTRDRELTLSQGTPDPKFWPN